MQIQTTTGRVACDMALSFWENMPLPPVSSTPYTVTGHNGTFSLSTKQRAIRVHHSALPDPLHAGKGSIIAVYAHDDAEHQQVGRNHPEQLIALTLGVPADQVQRYTGSNLIGLHLP